MQRQRLAGCSVTVFLLAAPGNVNANDILLTFEDKTLTPFFLLTSFLLADDTCIFFQQRSN